MNLNGKYRVGLGNVGVRISVSHFICTKNQFSSQFIVEWLVVCCWVDVNLWKTPNKSHHLKYTISITQTHLSLIIV